MAGSSPTDYVFQEGQERQQRDMPPCSGPDIDKDKIDLIQVVDKNLGSQNSAISSLVSPWITHYFRNDNVLWNELRMQNNQCSEEWRRISSVGKIYTTGQRLRWLYGAIAVPISSESYSCMNLRSQAAA